MTFNVISILPARQRREQSYLSSASTCMVVSEEFIQTIRAKTIKCTGVGMWGGRTVPAQHQSRLGCHQTAAEGTYNPLYVPCTARVRTRAGYGLRAPVTLSCGLQPSLWMSSPPCPLTHSYPQAPVLQQMPLLYFWKGTCRLRPCTHEGINRRIQPPQANLSSLCSHVFVTSCGTLLCRVKNAVFQRTGFKFKDNVMFIWNISVSEALADTLSVSPHLSQRQGANTQRKSRWDFFFRWGRKGLRALKLSSLHIPHFGNATKMSPELSRHAAK